MRHDSNYIYLDLLRGLSALAVCLGHLRALFFVDFERAQPGLLGKLFYFFTGFGHQAVIVFFVLSGFFIIRTIDQSRADGRWAVYDYSVSRLSRLWLVLAPALILTTTWDLVGTSLFPDALSYQGCLGAIISLKPIERITPEILAGNLFFLNTILVPSLGSNGPLWSLANEFWYYATFPMIYFAFVRTYSPLTRILLFSFGIGILAFVGVAIAAAFPIWLMGGIALVIGRSKRLRLLFGRTWLLFAILAGFFGLLVMIRLGARPLIANDYTLGLVTLFLVVTLVHRATPRSGVVQLARCLSDISYTLYVVHVPLAVFVCAWIAPTLRPLTATNMLTFTGIVILILFYAMCCWLLFERHTASIRRLILKLRPRPDVPEQIPSMQDRILSIDYNPTAKPSCGRGSHRST
jgi:peptidoglycan/LPS O-acetylase OafA/YrhL